MSTLLIDFVDKLKRDGYLHLWYTSLKSDNGNPSVRIYLQIHDDKEELVQTRLDSFLQENATRMGWTGVYLIPDPVIDPAYPHLREINTACELVLRLVSQNPDIDRINRQDFWRQTKNEVEKYLSSMDSSHHEAFIHFLANNLCLTDYAFIERLKGV